MDNWFNCLLLRMSLSTHVFSWRHGVPESLQQKAAGKNFRWMGKKLKMQQEVRDAKYQADLQH